MAASTTSASAEVSTSHPTATHASATGDAPLVLVTGVSGYIATWVAAALLHLGYRVRGTVRSLSNPAKTAFLRAETFAPGSRYRLELVEADLIKPESWPAAVAGATYVMHVASPFPLNSPRDPENELYKPARDGTLAVLRAVAAAEPRPRRVVLTSSFAAVGYGHAAEDTGPYTDDRWSNMDSSGADMAPYIRSKCIAERAAWDFLATLPESQRFELAAVNPSTVMGWIYAKQECTSGEIVSMMLDAKLPMVPEIELPWCDLRDVVRAHVAAMTVPAAAGKRFSVNSSQLDMLATARLLADRYVSKGIRVPTTRAPAVALWLASFFDSAAATSYKMLGRHAGSSDMANFRTVLGLTPQPDIRDAISAMAASLLTHGLVKAAGSPGLKPEDKVRPAGWSLEDVCAGLARA